MSTSPSTAAIARDATWLVQALDPAAGVTRLVRMDAAAYRAASFLDDRMLQQSPETHIVPWPLVRDAVAPGLRSDARWIFHIGHVGSTLVARLLGEIEGVLSIREPRFLRDVAMLDDRAGFIDAAPALFSRTFGGRQQALVKATSFVSEIADNLVPIGERALFMYASPHNYIGTILAGPNSVQELAALDASRRQRMGNRLSIPRARTQADSAAAAWACEMTALESAAERMTGRQVAWADFDRMLDDMPAELERLARHFGFAADGIAGIADGPLMRRYSKAAEYEYTPSLRRDLIAHAAEVNRADIDRAIAMLQSAAQNSPLLDRALRRAQCTESSKS